MGYLSTYSFLGIPESFYVFLLTLGFVLALTPWIPTGTDFGLFKTPTLPNIQRLKYIGPLVFMFILALALPIWPNSHVIVADASFNDQGQLDIKLSNLGDTPAFITKAHVKVLNIYALMPHSWPLSGVISTGNYTLTLPVKEFPYELDVDLSQNIPQKDVDRFTITIQPYFNGISSYEDITAIILMKQMANGTVTDADWQELENGLDASQKKLLDQLELTLHSAAFNQATLVFDFDLTLQFNQDLSLPIGRFLYSTGSGPDEGDFLPLSERNQQIVDTIAKFPAKRNALSSEFIELAVAPSDETPLPFDFAISSEKIPRTVLTGLLLLVIVTLFVVSVRSQNRSKINPLNIRKVGLILIIAILILILSKSLDNRVPTAISSVVENENFWHEGCIPSNIWSPYTFRWDNVSSPPTNSIGCLNMDKLGIFGTKNTLVFNANPGFEGMQGIYAPITQNMIIEFDMVVEKTSDGWFQVGISPSDSHEGTFLMVGSQKGSSNWKNSFAYYYQGTYMLPMSYSYGNTYKIRFEVENLLLTIYVDENQISYSPYYRLPIPYKTPTLWIGFVTFDGNLHAEISNLTMSSFIETPVPSPISFPTVDLPKISPTKTP